MSALHQVTISEADLRAKTVAVGLIVALDGFNAQYPDQDAEAVSDSFDYLTDNYLVQICASVFGEHHIIIPHGDEGLQAAFENAKSSAEMETMGWSQSRNDDNEVETG